MVYLTGDIHGNTNRIVRFCRNNDLSENDTVVILGDACLNYFDDFRDHIAKESLSRVNATVFCIHGNHEMRPHSVAGYEEKKWNGGSVWFQPEYPNILFAKDGDVFDLEGTKCLIAGGAYSVDKYYRIRTGNMWWDDEQPSNKIKRRVEKQVRAGLFSVVLSHTCPFKYEPVEMFLNGINQDTVDDSTEKWLDKIEELSCYDRWYCGHWHTDKIVDKIHFLYEGFDIL